MIPPQIVIVPNYLLFADLGLINTYWALILPHVPTAIGTFLMRQAFLALPSAPRQEPLERPARPGDPTPRCRPARAH